MYNLFHTNKRHLKSENIRRFSSYVFFEQVTASVRPRLLQVLHSNYPLPTAIFENRPKKNQHCIFIIVILIIYNVLGVMSVGLSVCAHHICELLHQSSGKFRGVFGRSVGWLIYRFSSSHHTPIFGKKSGYLFLAPTFPSMFSLLFLASTPALSSFLSSDNRNMKK